MEREVAIAEFVKRTWGGVLAVYRRMGRDRPSLFGRETAIAASAIRCRTGIVA
ncbi:hypothetical protein F8B43_0474 [Methylorubrum populi]|uniref:Uncharacterized protein n=1 Tax=Methylorubrum populi TaxID=223967 RepID=A0A833J9K4_9HYPH|nr:hypothetical protein F8B43_0474 [Methylorubrum populi]